MEVEFVEKGDTLTIIDSSLSRFSNKYEAGFLEATGDGKVVIENC